MNYSFIRLWNCNTVLQCSKLRNAPHTVGPSARNITSLTYRNYFQLCSRRGLEKCQNNPLQGFIANSWLQFNRNSSRHARLPEQVLLYSYDNPKFLRMVNLFGLSFGAFWFFTTYQFATMRITPAHEKRTHNLPWFARFDLVSSTAIKIFATLLSASLGCGVLGGSWFYSMRSVGKVILEKGGKTVAITTYNPATFSMSNTMKVNLSDMSAQGHRTVNNVVPIKVKGRWMYFLVSNEGTYHNASLFDKTVGLQRSL